MHERNTVGTAAHVELDAVGPEAGSSDKGGNCVLWRESRSTAVAEDQRHRFTGAKSGYSGRSVRQ